MKFVNIADIAKIAVMSYAAIWVINRTLTKVGLSQYRA